MDFKCNVWAGQGVYSAPSVAVLDLQNEGLLCQSGQFDRADVGYGDNQMEGI